MKLTLVDKVALSGSNASGAGRHVESQSLLWRDRADNLDSVNSTNAEPQRTSLCPTVLAGESA